MYVITYLLNGLQSAAKEIYPNPEACATEYDKLDAKGLGPSIHELGKGIVKVVKWEAVS